MSAVSRQRAARIDLALRNFDRQRRLQDTIEMAADEREAAALRACTLLLAGDVEGARREAGSARFWQLKLEELAVALAAAS